MIPFSFTILLIDLYYKNKEMYFAYSHYVKNRRTDDPIRRRGHWSVRLSAMM